MGLLRVRAFCQASMGAGKSKGDNEDKVDHLAREAPNDQLLAAARDLPLPRGHAILIDFADALDREYARGEGPIVGDWLDKLSEARLTSAGLEVPAFITWTEWVEALIRRSYDGQMVMSIEQLRAEWGLIAPAQAMAAGVSNVPIAYGYAAQPVGASCSSCAHVPVAVAEPVYGKVRCRSSRSVDGQPCIPARACVARQWLHSQRANSLLPNKHMFCGYTFSGRV